LIRSGHGIEECVDWTGRVMHCNAAGDSRSMWRLGVSFLNLNLGRVEEKRSKKHKYTCSQLRRMVDAKLHIVRRCR
jgi:hypothetical protein